MTTNKMWLGDPDCGEGLPNRPTRGPCHPPDGPCVPLKRPSYPAKPKPPKKDLCIKCPPKKPCNLNKCPPDTDGTCGKAMDHGVDLLKLNSESQAVIGSAVRPSPGNQAIKYHGGPIWNGDCRHQLEQASFNFEVPRRFFSTHNASGNPPEKSTPSEKTTSRPVTSPKTKSTHKQDSMCEETSKKASKASTDCKETPKKVKPDELQPRVLYRKCPPPPKLPKLPECLKTPKIKAPEPCVKINPPKCPPLPLLPKCPECPTHPVKSKDKSSSPCRKEDAPSSSKVCSSKKDGNKKETKGFWQKLTECAKRKMSTYARSSLNFEDDNASGLKYQTRDFSTSGSVTACFSSNSDSPPSLPPWKQSKCKTIEEVCGEKVDKKLKALECNLMDCPKNPNAECYPEKPRCAEVRKPVKKNMAAAKVSSSKRRLDSSGRKMNNCDSPVAAKPVEKIDYTKTKCEPSKFQKLGPCPTLPSIWDKKQRVDEMMEKPAAPIPLPKPPSCPVVLCPCSPPRKVHPGSCPCYDETDDSQLKPPSEPCPEKPKYSCPVIPVYYCPPTKDACEKNDGSGKKKPKKP